MKKVYVSSTYSDLVEYRRAVYNTLRAMRLDPIAMEDSPAVDARPLDDCCENVKKADLYIGIFAWRYGYIPDPSVGKSITEFEYEAASGKPRLLFLTRESAQWPAHFVDGVGDERQDITKIRAFRKLLKTKKTVRFFETPDELAAWVAISVYNYLIKESITRAIDEAISLQIREGAIQQSDVDSSLLQHILETTVEQDAQALRVNIGTGWSWWSTRLYLLTALALDVTDTRLLVFVDSNDQFVGLASPRNVRDALVARYRYLQQWEEKLAAEGDTEFGAIEEVYARAEAFKGFMTELGKKAKGPEGRERDIKTFIRRRSLADLLDGNLHTTHINLDGDGDFLQAVLKILHQPSAYVAVTHEGHLRIVDRVQFSTEIATVLLNSWSSLMMS